MAAELEKLSEIVVTAESLEQLTRPLLEMLQLVTGLESTYLTSIDLTHGVQNVSYANNSGELKIPEGLVVPWDDTLCKRCLDEGRRYVSNVREVWGDSEAAAALGIQTYASAPVCSSDGAVIGTLCAASKSSKKLGARARVSLNVFAKLIAQHIEGARLLQELRRSNAHLANYALTDTLTGLPNRRSLQDELVRLLARAGRDGSYVLVGLIDMDGFKQVNDQHGHAIGDQLLQACAQRLASVSREADILARLGGDEFALAGPAPQTEAEREQAQAHIRKRIAEATTGIYQLSDVTLNYPGVSVGIVAVRGMTVEQALEAADEAMYRDKRARKDKEAVALPQT
jgi:diguanylate cyclase